MAADADNKDEKGMMDKIKEMAKRTWMKMVNREENKKDSRRDGKHWLL